MRGQHWDQLISRLMREAFRDIFIEEIESCFKLHCQISQ